MKPLLIAASTFLFSLSAVFAGAPSDATKAYYATLKKKDYVAAAKTFDPAALKAFRDTLSFFNDLPDEEAGDTLSMFFGEGASKASVKKMSDAEFFASFLKGSLEEMEEATGTEPGEVQVVGELPEGEDVVHVVTRNKSGVGGLKIETMEVLSFKKTADGWKALLPGEMGGLAAQLKEGLGSGGAASGAVIGGAVGGMPDDETGDDEKKEEAPKAEEKKK